jgi:O-antigen/teichoic acid export membrane protein
MALVSRALGLLPSGTLLVGAGLAVLGAGSYAQLAVAGHTLSTGGTAAMSVLWTIVFWAGLGVFFPVEQELIRLVAARQATGEGISPVVRRAAAAAGGIWAALLVPLTIAARPLADSLFGGNTAMVIALAAALLALAVASVSRGVLAGTGRFAAYGSQLAVDGGLRIVLACGLGAAGLHSPAALGLTMTVAPLLAAACTLRPLLRELRPGPAVPWMMLCRGLRLLIPTMLLAQLVVNVAIINVRLLSPGDPAVVGALLAAMILARVPLFVFTSLQASLLPGLAGAIAAGDQARFRQLVIRGCAVVTVLGIGAGVPAAIAGPWLTRLLFAARPVLGHADFAVLAAGTLCYMLAMVLGQGAMALSRHRDQLLAWLAGTAVLAAITLGPGDVRLRVEVAYTVSSLTVAGALALVLFLRGRALRPALAARAGCPGPSGTRRSPPRSSPRRAAEDGGRSRPGAGREHRAGPPPADESSAPG